jgi:Ca2+:H+ antiporter
MAFRIDQLRSEYRRAAKDGLPAAIGLIKSKDRSVRRAGTGDLELGHTKSAADVEDPTQGPSEPHARHAVTDPIGGTSSGYNGTDDIVTKRQNTINKEVLPDGSTAPETPITPVDGVKTEQDDDARSSGQQSSDSDENSGKRSKWRSGMFKPSPVPVVQQIRRVLFPHIYTINWLLIAVPVGIALHFTKVNPLAVFVVNFLAIVPLAGILSFATEEIALRVGEVLGGLLNASFGNAVELIVGIIALTKKEIIIVQTSLVGSILSNLLLVMGMCFFFGGWSRTHQNFNTTVAQTAASLLALSVGALVIPTAYTWGNPSFVPGESTLDEQLSRGTAIIMLFVYAAYLFFQLKSHRAIFSEASDKVQKKPKRVKRHRRNIRKAVAGVGHRSAKHAVPTEDFKPEENPRALEDEEPEEPTLSFWGALLTLCIVTALVGICAEFLVDSISAVTCTYGVSDYFVGLILLPIVGNAAEHATAVTVAIKDKMDLAIGVAVGSSMQIALLVLPLMVVLGWIIHADMTLLFDSFQIAVLFVAIILVNYLIADGKSRKLCDLDAE